MAMPGRTYALPGSVDDTYRYSHNGQEKDNEIFVGALSAEYWEYDSRTGRRWERDPLSYDWQSSYACFNNNPVYYRDALGLEGTNEDGDGDETKPRPGEGKKRTEQGGKAKDGFETATGKRDQGDDGTNRWESVDNGETTYVKYTRKDGSGGGWYGTPSESNSGGSNPSSGGSETGGNNPSSSGAETGGKDKSKETPKPDDGDKNKSTPNVHTDPSAQSLKAPPPPRNNILPQGGPRIPARPILIPRPRVPNVVPQQPIIPPAAPNPSSLCFHCFIGETTGHWDNGVKEMANWLLGNPNYKITIFSDGGGKLGLFGGNKWNDRPFLGNPANATFIQRLGQRYNQFRMDVIKAGEGKIAPNRLLLNPSNVDGETFEYKVTN